MRGFVYIVSNASMPGLVKVGFTTRMLAQRMSELQSTGVPTPFIVEFFAEVDAPALLEARAHVRLAKNRHGKEFFKCSLAKSVEAVKLAIPECGVHLFATGGLGKASYLTEDEIELLRHEAAEERARQELAEREREARLKAKRAEDDRIRACVDDLTVTALPVAALVNADARREATAVWGRAGIGIAGYALILVFPPILILFLVMTMGDTEKREERRKRALAMALPEADRNHLRAFVNVLSRLQREQRLDPTIACLVASGSAGGAAFVTRIDRITLAPHVLDLVSGLAWVVPEIKALTLDARTAKVVRIEARKTAAVRKAA